MAATKGAGGGLNVVHVFGLILALLLAVGAYKWFKGYQVRAELQAEIERSAALRAALDADKAKITVVLRKWDDAIGLANITSRIALAQPVSQMQAVRREMEDLKTNPCFEKGTKQMVGAMNNALFAFEMFAKYPNSTAPSAYFDKMREGFGAANDTLAECYPQPKAAASAPSV